MVMLSKSFDSSEFACRCCGVCNINPFLVEGLQELRNMVGLPIHISSGYRCPRHNRAVGGAANSQHIAGNAADIVIQGYGVRAMFNAACQIPMFNNGGIGIYPQNGFIHVDVRNGAARWARVNGVYVSLDEGLKYC